MAVTTVEATHAGIKDVVKAYVALTKPRIIELLLVTTLPAMFLAAKGLPPLIPAVATLFGGWMAAASANTFNCILDADIDEVMRRTRRRPMPRHQVGTVPATVFGLVLAVVSALILGFGANWLSAGLALGANAFYVFIYTMWLKRRTWQNIIWGGIAGCFPPLIGWTAVADTVAWPPLIMFGIVFLWTPPHTWALSFRYKDDYAAAGVPMLPVVRAAPKAATQILLYTVLTVLLSLVLWPVTPTGLLYPIVAAVAGMVMILEAVKLRQRACAGIEGAALKAMRLFHFSNTYLAVLFLAIALDPLFFGK